VILCACASQEKIIILPESEQKEEQNGIAESTEIIETQDGTGSENLPDWVKSFINGGISHIEALEPFKDKYAFIGKTRGSSFSALQQWSERFTVYHDFPRLAAARIENRLVSAASLYPDDEYGEFFETLVKKSSDAEYSGAVKEETYWTKVLVRQDNNFEDDEPAEPLELYEFFVLISIDKVMMQRHIHELMANIRTAIPPTRSQRASISRVQQIFFEGF